MKSKNRETFKWNEITSTILKFKIPPGDTLHCIPLPSSSPSHDSKLSNRIQPIDTRDISTTLSSLSNKKTQKTPVPRTRHTDKWHCQHLFPESPLDKASLEARAWSIFRRVQPQKSRHAKHPTTRKKKTKGKGKIERERGRNKTKRKKRKKRKGLERREDSIIPARYRVETRECSRDILWSVLWRTCDELPSMCACV